VTGDRPCPADGQAMRYAGGNGEWPRTWRCPAGHRWGAASPAGELTAMHQSWCRTRHDLPDPTCEAATRRVDAIADAIAAPDYVPDGLDPRQAGCDCKYRLLSEQPTAGGWRTASHETTCALMIAGLPVWLKAGTADPVQLGTITARDGADPDVALGLFLQEWAAAYLRALAAAGRTP